MMYLTPLGVPIYLAQIDTGLNAYSQLQIWQVFGLLLAGLVIVLIYRERTKYTEIKSESDTAHIAMTNNQTLTQQLTKSIDVLDKFKDQIGSQGETIRLQNEQTIAATRVIEALANRVEGIHKGQDTLIDAVMATRLTIDENNKIMTGISDNVEAIAIKAGNLGQQLEADTNATQDLITKRAETTIQAIRDTFESLSTTLIRFEKALTESSKQHMCKELGEISTTLNEIRAQLNAQKEARNETHIPTVDLPVMPDTGKSGNGTGDTTTHPND